MSDRHNQQHNMQQDLQRAKYRMVLIMLLAISLLQFIDRVSADFGTYFSVDMPLFLYTAYDYLALHTLYVRAENLPEYYQPGAGVYKYPPLYQLTIVPWFAQGWPEHVYFMILRICMLLMYLASAGLMMRKVASLQNEEFPQKMFYSIATITTLWFIPFHGSEGVVSEIYLLFLFSLFIYFYTSKPVLSGIVLGISCMLKIYPIFLIGVSMLEKNKQVIAGLIIACLLATLVTMAYFGWEENRFFFLELLPVLLSEPVSDYGSNLNIQAFFLSIGSISESFPLFLIQKILVLGVLVLISYRLQNTFEKNKLLIFSLWICGILLLLSNYWLQYQLLLLLPIIVLLSHTLKKYSAWPCIIMTLVIITLSIDDRWSDSLISHALEKKQLTTDMAMEMVKNHGVLYAGLEISPLAMLTAMIIYIFSVLKVFVPHLLFLLTLWALSDRDKTKMESA